MSTLTYERVVEGPDALRLYLREISKFVQLSPDEEKELGARVQRGDEEAFRKLIEANLRFVVAMAKKYSRSGYPLHELINEGNLGLIEAVSRFDPTRGVRFITYASWWIRASIQDYVLRSWSLVKIGTTANQKKLFFKLRSAQRKISAFERGDLHPDQVTSIAKSLNVAEQDVVDMNRRLRGDASLNAPIQDDGEADEWQSYLVDQSPSPEATVADEDERDCQHKALARAIDVLNDRERRISEARHLADEPLTLEELALEFNVSRERIRQIDTRAFEKVRKATKKLVAEAQTPVALPA